MYMKERAIVVKIPVFFRQRNSLFEKFVEKLGRAANQITPVVVIIILTPSTISSQTAMIWPELLTVRL